jgi:rhamnulokinase
MAKKAYLAFDLGAESGRAIVGVLDAGRLELHEVHRFLNVPRRLPSGLHWDLTGLWGHILDGGRKAIAWANEAGIHISSLGVDTWGVDWALVGKSGELLGLPHCYRDEAHGPAYEKTLAKLGKKAIYETTGVQFMPLNTLYQLVARHDSAPELLDNAAHLLFIPDLLHYFFSGKPVVESSIASTSQMVDPRTGKWATGLLKQLGLPTHMLGEIVKPGTRIGPVLPHIATELGATGELQVITPGGHDTAAAVAAVPVDKKNGEWAYISSGTWSLMGMELDAPNFADDTLSFTNEGGIDGTIRYLKNIAGLWLVQECRRHYEKQGIVYDYTKLTQFAEAAEPFRTIVNPDHAPFLAPGEMPIKIARFARETGQPEPVEVGQFVRCCLESLALTYRHVLAGLERVTGRKVKVLHIVGGGGRNALLSQLTANAIGRPVIVGPYEATAAGNILVQAMGAGDVKDLAEIRRIITTSFEPQTYFPLDTVAWDVGYKRFTALLGR